MLILPNVTQCDEGKPVCTKCIKSKRRCLGYREEADLLFRNETQATVVRAQWNFPPSASHLVEPLAPNATLYTLASGICKISNVGTYWRSRLRPLSKRPSRNFLA